jgi:hypothetical protein
LSALDGLKNARNDVALCVSDATFRRKSIRLGWVMALREALRELDRRRRSAADRRVGLDAKLVG